MARVLASRHARLVAMAAIFALSLLSLNPSFSVTAQTSFSLPGAIGGTTSTSAPASASTSSSSAPTATSTSPATPTTPASSGNASTVFCPAMLLPNIRNLNISTCAAGCCLPCPPVNNFYEAGVVANLMQDARITRYVSSILCFFMVFSFLILPGKLEQPYLTILYGAAMAGMMNVSLEVMNEKQQCVNEFEFASADNSWRCVVQSFGIIYFSLSATLWDVVLIVKLHMLAVWRSNPIDRHFKKVAVVPFLLPLCFALPVVTNHLAANPGVGSGCMTAAEHLNTYLFYPLAALVYPSMAIHLVTVVKMIQISMMTSNGSKSVEASHQNSNGGRQALPSSTRQLRSLIRGQWRPAILLGINMVVTTLFWLFFYVDARRLVTVTPDTPWFQQWLGCLISETLAAKSNDDAQTFCAAVAKPNVPHLAWFRAAEALLGMVGIVVFLVFGTKTEFWSDWHELIRNLITRGKKGPGGRRSGGSSPDLSESRNNTMHNERSGSRAAARNQSPVHNLNAVGHHNGNPHNGGGNNYKQDSDGQQWYDMDDFMDKETKSTTNLNRNVSFNNRPPPLSTNNNNIPSSSTNHHNNSSSSRNNSAPSSNELPFYTENGDLLYRPPKQQIDTSIQTPARIYDRQAGTSTPTPTYEQYVPQAQAVIPQPVPRTPKLQNAVYLSSPASPTITTGFGMQQQQQSSSDGYHTSQSAVGRSLSPMPNKSPTSPTSSNPNHIRRSPHQQQLQQQQQQQHNYYGEQPQMSPTTSAFPTSYSSSSSPASPSATAVAASRIEGWNSSGGGGSFILQTAEPIANDLRDSYIYPLSSPSLSHDLPRGVNSIDSGSQRRPFHQQPRTMTGPAAAVAGSTGSSPSVPNRNPTRLNTSQELW